jgi:hypothetical protein
MTALRTVSYGGGVQSTALLVLAAQKVIDFPMFLMSNVGDDSEHPATLAYVKNFAGPYAEAHGINLRLLDRQRRDGTTETLYGRLMKEGSRSLPIPVRMDNGAPGTRSCTADFKIRVIAKELKRLGAHAGRGCKEHTVPAVCSEHQKPKAKQPCRFHPDPDCSACVQPNPATVGIGISLDEIGRANSRIKEAHERVVYPLVGIGEETGLRMTRSDCERVIRDAALPVPPKSSCYFCPFHKPEAWADLRRNEPDLFEKAAVLEDTLNARRNMLGKDNVWLTRFAVPLRDAVHTDAPLFDVAEDNGCDSGWCMT